MCFLLNTFLYIYILRFVHSIFVCAFIYMNEIELWSTSLDAGICDSKLYYAHKIEDLVAKNGMRNTCTHYCEVNNKYITSQVKESKLEQSVYIMQTFI